MSVNRKSLKKNNNQCFGPYYRCEIDVFLKRYDFAYSYRTTVNQAAKQFHYKAPRLIKKVSNEVDRLACDRILKIINQSRQQRGLCQK